MKNSTNIYDIDGELIRGIDDTHKWTADEVKEKIEYYRNKLNGLDKEDKKAILYTTYMRNLSNYLLILYSQMTKPQLKAEIDKARREVTNEQIVKAIEELSKEVNNDGETAEDTTDEVPAHTPEDNKDTADEKLGNDAPIDGGNSDVHEDGPKPEDDILVERGPVMDEYVEFEEVKDGE